MGYYIRVLGLQDIDIHLDELSAALKAAGLNAALQLGESCEPRKWSMLEAKTERGVRLVQIERNRVVPGKLAQQELDEFRVLIRAHQPLSAVQWLDKYFGRIAVVYAFRVLDAAMLEDNYEIVSTLKTAIWGERAVCCRTTRKASPTITGIIFCGSSRTISPAINIAPCWTMGFGCGSG